MLLGDTSGLTKLPPGPRPTALLHDELEKYLGRYIGLLLYMRELEENIYSKLCAVSGILADWFTVQPNSLAPT